MIAAGAVPLWMASRSTPLPEHDPRPDGMTSTRPVANCPLNGWRRSIMTPVSGSNPPQKLSGASAANASPCADAGNYRLALHHCYAAHGPSTLHDAARDRGCDALLCRGEYRIDAE